MCEGKKRVRKGMGQKHHLHRHGGYSTVEVHLDGDSTVETPTSVYRDGIKLRQQASGGRKLHSGTAGWGDF